jgi:hypothetical protein
VFVTLGNNTTAVAVELLLATPLTPDVQSSIKFRLSKELETVPVFEHLVPPFAGR